MPDITDSVSWKALAAARETLPGLKTLFARDPDRFKTFSRRLPGMLVDFSKTPVTAEILDGLLDLARQAGLEEARTAFFGGEKVNVTENRPAFHMALRAPWESMMRIDGEDVVPEARQTLRRMGFFANDIRNGARRGHSGRKITDIVNIGIGGSVLGPQLATEALSLYHHPDLACHYVSNVDASDLSRVLRKLSPETTLFIIASKTFTTAETMQNARLAREWVLSHYRGVKRAIESHFVAASVNNKAVADFGIAPQAVFPFQDWVGGRYSVWSSIGLSTMIMIGPELFAEFLAGAHGMDEHFRAAPLKDNIPVLLGLIGLWQRNFMGYTAQAVIPYHSLLRRLPTYLQQLDMESNGKSVTRDNAEAPLKTGPLVFGEPGTDAQHIFFQWLQQGTDTVPVDFIAALRTGYENREQRNMLLANLFAQSEALMNGQEDKDRPCRRYPGNRPSTTILLDSLDARSLGMMLAMYEHKIFVQGILWNINSFDQWGVELGKVLAGKLERELAAGIPGAHDSSTRGLLEYALGSNAEEARLLAA